MVVGADAGGGPNVTVYDAATGAVRFNFFAYDPNLPARSRRDWRRQRRRRLGYHHSGRDPAADRTSTSTTAAPARSSGTSSPLRPNFTGGCYVAVGDLNGDGMADIGRRCPTPAAEPHVAAFSGLDNAVLANSFPYPAVTPGRRQKLL